jgi:hypothetical protein
VGDNSGFDFVTFMSEISRLKLSNQHMTITVQVVDNGSIQSEKGIGLGLASCKREGVVPGPNTRRPDYYQFFDESCVWSHLHPYDEKNVLENKFKLDKRLSLQTQHVVRTGSTFCHDFLHCQCWHLLHLSDCHTLPL